MNKVIKIIIAIIVLGFLVWAVGTKSEPNEPGENTPIKIGVIAPLTGPVADYGEEVRKGVMAGAPASGVEFVFEDDKCDPKEAVSAFKKLAEFDKMQFIIGPACGSSQEAIVPLLAGKEIMTVVPAAASSALYAQSGNNFFNIQYSLQDESKFVAEKMTALGYTKVALVSYANAFSKAHADSFREHFAGTIAIDSVITDENTNLATEVTKIKAARVDAIYSPDISFFFASGLAKLREQGVIAPVFSTYVVELPAVREVVADVMYSYPAEIADTEAAVFGLSKRAAELLSQTVLECEGAYQCVHDKLTSSGPFDQNGIYRRSMLLKQIKNSVPTVINS